MKPRLIATYIWLQVYFPVLVPLIDRLAHCAGICLGN